MAFAKDFKILQKQFQYLHIILAVGPFNDMGEI